MEIKKNDKANLEKKRSIFMQLGLVVVLAVILGLFEYSTKPESDEEMFASQTVLEEEESIPITMAEPPPPPPEPEPPKVIESFELLENDADIDDDLDLLSDEDDQDLAMEIIEYVEEEEEEEEEIFVIVQEKPKFPGGEAKLFQWITENTVYPDRARENGIQGTVYVQFVVGKSGEISRVSVIRGVHPDLDAEAIRVVKSMPKWKPGQNAGKSVSVQYQLPIRFKLTE
jgi:protein TonB